MKLSEYINLKRGNALGLSRALGVSMSFISQMASGHRGVSASYAMSIEKATDGAVSRKDLRPDDWAQIWPELAEQKAAA